MPVEADEGAATQGKTSGIGDEMSVTSAILKRSHDKTKPIKSLLRPDVASVSTPLTSLPPIYVTYMPANQRPRVSVAQRDILIEFIEQHPYLARATTSLSRRLSAARKKELWDEVAAVLNQRGPAVKTPERWRNHWSKLVHAARREAARSAAERTSTGGGKVGGVDGRVLDVLSRTGAVVTDAPQFFEQSDELPRRQLRDLEEVVQRTAEEYVRQGEAANARAQEEARFHQQLVELHRQPTTVKLTPDEVESAKKILAKEATKAPCEEDIPLQMKIMRDCYPLIRKFINSADPVHSAKDIKETWPLLFRKEHLLDHLHRLTGVQLEGKLSNIPRDVLLLLTSFLRSNTGNDRVVEWSLKVTHAETNLGHKDAASLGLIPLIVSYFKDDLDYLIQVHEGGDVGSD
ncbi:hypothetical protein HPB50_028380 [Hyalomma asiaticum]|nr:hypothetical protein HPB50_028380 [Hyalomma asiaticum]